jgi:hypothetical protein
MSGTKRAADDVISERRAQILRDGYHHTHDDGLVAGELAKMAACWAASSVALGSIYTGHQPEQYLLTFHRLWDYQWGADPGQSLRAERRKKLVVAGALILAEIERLDRAESEALKLAHALQGD